MQTKKSIFFFSRTITYPQFNFVFCMLFSSFLKVNEYNYIFYITSLGIKHDKFYKDQLQWQRTSNFQILIAYSPRL